MISSSQSEIWGTASYRKTSQARYVAEAGAQQAMNWLTSNNGTLAALSDGSFNLGAAPVQYIGNTTCLATPTLPQCVVRMTSNPGSPMVGGITDTVSTFDTTSAHLSSGFSTALGPTTTSSNFDTIAGSGNAYFTVAAQLIVAYNTGNGWLTKWKITSQGTVGAPSGSTAGVQPATVQVVEVIENDSLPTNSVPTVLSSFPYGAFATSASCPAITINGGSSIVSYSSTASAGVANPSWTYSGGSIGTLGNVSLTGGAYVYGGVSAPGYNIGNSSATVYYPYGVSGGGAWPYNNGSQACSSSTMYAVNEDNSGSAIQCVNSTSNCTNKASQLPTTITSSTYSTADTMVGSTLVTVPPNTSTCNYNGICSGGSGNGNPNLTLPPSTTASNVVNYGVASFGGSTTTTLNAGSYFFDTLSLGGSATMNIASSPIVIYIQDTSAAIPLNITGGSFSNSGGVPNNLTFVYNGTQEIHIGSISSNTLFATIYAPNAKIVFDGNGSIYGAVIGNTVSVTGGGHIIYDTTLGSTTTHVYTNQSGSSVSPLHLTNFSWSVF
jgi:hypothetical protein